MKIVNYFSHFVTSLFFFHKSKQFEDIWDILLRPPSGIALSMATSRTFIRGFPAEFLEMMKCKHNIKQLKKKEQQQEETLLRLYIKCKRLMKTEESKIQQENVQTSYANYSDETENIVYRFSRHTVDKAQHLLFVIQLMTLSIIYQSNSSKSGILNKRFDDYSFGYPRLKRIFENRFFRSATNFFGKAVLWLYGFVVIWMNLIFFLACFVGVVYFYAYITTDDKCGGDYIIAVEKMHYPFQLQSLSPEDVITSISTITQGAYNHPGELPFLQELNKPVTLFETFEMCPFSNFDVQAYSYFIAAFAFLLFAFLPDIIGIILEPSGWTAQGITIPSIGESKILRVSALASLIGGVSVGYLLDGLNGAILIGLGIETLSTMMISIVVRKHKNTLQAYLAELGTMKLIVVPNSSLLLEKLWQTQNVSNVDEKESSNQAENQEDPRNIGSFLLKLTDSSSSISEPYNRNMHRTVRQIQYAAKNRLNLEAPIDPLTFYDPELDILDSTRWFCTIQQSMKNMRNWGLVLKDCLQRIMLLSSLVLLYVMLFWVSADLSVNSLKMYSLHKSHIENITSSLSFNEKRSLAVFTGMVNACNKSDDIEIDEGGCFAFSTAAHGEHMEKYMRSDLQELFDLQVDERMRDKFGKSLTQIEQKLHYSSHSCTIKKSLGDKDLALSLFPIKSSFHSLTHPSSLMTYQKSSATSTVSCNQRTVRRILADELPSSYCSAWNWRTRQWSRFINEALDIYSSLQWPSIDANIKSMNDAQEWALNSLELPDSSESWYTGLCCSLKLPLISNHEGNLEELDYLESMSESSLEEVAIMQSNGYGPQMGTFVPISKLFIMIGAEKKNEQEFMAIWVSNLAKDSISTNRLWWDVGSPFGRVISIASLGYSSSPDVFDVIVFGTDNGKVVLVILPHNMKSGGNLVTYGYAFSLTVPNIHNGERVTALATQPKFSNQPCSVKDGALLDEVEDHIIPSYSISSALPTYTGFFASGGRDGYIRIVSGIQDKSDVNIDFGNIIGEWKVMDYVVPAMAKLTVMNSAKETGLYQALENSNDPSIVLDSLVDTANSKSIDVVNLVWLSQQVLVSEILSEVNVQEGSSLSSTERWSCVVVWHVQIQANITLGEQKAPAAEWIKVVPSLLSVKSLGIIPKRSDNVTHSKISTFLPSHNILVSALESRNGITTLQFPPAEILVQRHKEWGKQLINGTFANSQTHGILQKLEDMKLDPPKFDPFSMVITRTVLLEDVFTIENKQGKVHGYPTAFGFDPSTFDPKV